MTMVLEGTQADAQHVKRELNRLIHVITVEDMNGTPYVTRDLALIKVQATPETKSEILQMCGHYRARIVDVAMSSIVVEVVGEEPEIEGLAGLLQALRDHRDGPRRRRRHGPRRKRPRHPLRTLVLGRAAFPVRESQLKEYTMATLYYDNDADLTRLDGKTIAVLGFGSQGHAHALNLSDNGADVVVGLRLDSSSWAEAEEQGLKVMTTDEACRAADMIMVLVPDTEQAAVYEADIAPNLEAGNTLMFAHGFNIRYGQIHPPADVDVSMVAPKAPGPPGS